MGDFLGGNSPGGKLSGVSFLSGNILGENFPRTAI